MASIFLSYSREDRRFAETIASALERAGHSVWWDRYIDGGSEFSAEIEAEIEQADIVLVAWSKDAARSPWVRDEATIGRDTGRLLPVLVDGSQPPIGFRQFQAVSLIGWKGETGDSRTAALHRAIQRRLKAKGKAAPRWTASEPKPRLAWPTGKPLWAIAAALVLLIAAGAALLIVRAGRVHAPPASLAVLPFKNMAAGDSYFAEGVAEEIANQLGREPQFKVAGRTSSSLFKDAADLRDVGRRLHVAYVLEGSVRSAGDQVRVAVSLVETRRGTRLWSQDFRGKLDDIFAIQDRIGQQVAANVKRQLVAKAPSGALTTSGEVYTLYVTARSLIRDRTPANVHTAVGLLRNAIAVDPNYAPAWAAYAHAERLDFLMNTSAPEVTLESERQLWLRDARHALELAPNLAEAHTTMAFVLSTYGQDDPATSEALAKHHLERAAQLNPNDAETWNGLAQHYEWAGDYPRALHAWRRLYSIDPLWWRAFSNNIRLAWEMGYRNEAQAIAQRIEKDADPFQAMMARSDINNCRRNLAKAYRYLEAARELGDPGQKWIVTEFGARTLRSVGLWEQARKNFSPPIDGTTWQMWNGQAPSASYVAQRARDPHLWSEDTMVDFMLRTLVKSGRVEEVVRLYDLRFRSPEHFIATWPLAHANLVELTPVVAMALREVGRAPEADRLLALVDSKARETLRRGPAPGGYFAAYAKLLSVMDRRDEAIGALQKALRLGWFYNAEDNAFRRIADEPAFRSIASDPRFIRIQNFFAIQLTAQRRELGPIAS